MVPGGMSTEKLLSISEHSGPGPPGRVAAELLPSLYPKGNDVIPQRKLGREVTRTEKESQSCIEGHLERSNALPLRDTARPVAPPREEARTPVSCELELQLSCWKAQERSGRRRVDRGSGVGGRRESCRSVCAERGSQARSSTQEAWGRKDKVHRGDQDTTHRLFRGSIPAHQRHFASFHGLLCTLCKSHVDFGNPPNLLGSPMPQQAAILRAPSLLPAFFIRQKGSCLEQNGQFLSLFRLKTCKSDILQYIFRI